jgi:GNAT superfamily N-acetyltransferase
MITIDLLKNHPNCIQTLAGIWYQTLGQVWLPEIEVKEIESWYHEWINDKIPLALVAFFNDTPVGACSLQSNDGIRPELSPWIGDLVVDPAYQERGIGKLLLETAKENAKKLGYKKLYLFTFSKTLPDYYERQGWEYMGMDEYRGHPVTVMGIPL